MNRPETGPMQFGDDWPGIFIRGDGCFGYQMAVEQALAFFKANPVLVSPELTLHLSQLEGLRTLLRFSDTRNKSAPSPLKLRPIGECQP